MDPISFIAVTAITLAANAAISYMFPSSGPRLKDLKISASTYGAGIPRVYGTVRTGGNCIWAAAPVEHKSTQSAGKGGSEEVYTYTCSFAMAFAEGPVQSILRLWADGNLIYDATGLSEVKNTDPIATTFYLGTEEQLPDPAITADKGDDNTPAYRGLAYVVFTNFPLTDYGNRIPQFAAQIAAVSSSVAPYTSLTYASPTIFTGWSAPYNGSRGLVDYTRGYLYLMGSAAAGNGLSRVRLADSIEDLQVPGSKLIIGGQKLTSLVAIAPDGTLIVGNSTSPYQPISRIDPISYQVISTWGLATSSGPVSSTIGTQASGPAVYSLDGTLLAVPEPTRVRLHDGYLLTYIGGLGTTTGTSGDLISVCPFGLNDVCAMTVDSGVMHLQTSLSGTVYSETESGATYKWVVYDQSQPGLIFGYNQGSNSYIAKYSTDTLAIAWRLQVQGSNYISGNSRLLSNELCFTSGALAYVIDTVAGAFIDRDADPYVLQKAYEINFAAYSANNDGNQGWAIPVDVPTWQVYDSIRQDLISLNQTSSGSNYIINAGLGAGAETSLDQIIEAHLRDANLTSEDFDLSLLEPIGVHGYGYASQTDIKGVFAELRQVYLFDLFESDFILKARVRGDTEPDMIIGGDSLGSSEPTATDYWKQTRMQEDELPNKIVISYMDVNQDFETSTAQYQRPSDPIPVMFSPQQAVVQTSIVMDATDAMNIVRKMVYTQWTERVKHETRLPWQFIQLDPSDLITVNLDDGRSFFERIDGMDLGADMTIVTETMNQDGGAYALTAITGDGGGLGGTTLSAPRPIRQFIYNLPLMRDTDDSGGTVSNYYVCAGSDAGVGVASYSGGVLYRSTNGVDYNRLVAEPNGVEWGVVMGTLPYPRLGVYAMDYLTQINIAPAVGGFTLSTITYDELMQGQNLFIVGAEVMQFQNAVENSDGTWTISNLLRGRRGTEWASYEHGPAEFAIFPSSTNVIVQSETLSARGQGRWFSGVGTGLTLSATTPNYITYMPRDLMPYAPEQIRRTFQSNGDCLITWERRTRIGGDLMDGTPTVPLNETSESYEIYILNGYFIGDVSTNSPPTGYLRMYASSANSTTYTAAQQAADGFSATTSTLWVIVYQVSGSVGRGFPGGAGIAPWQNDIWIVAQDVAGDPVTAPVATGGGGATTTTGTATTGNGGIASTPGNFGGGGGSFSSIKSGSYVHTQED